MKKKILTVLLILTVTVLFANGEIRGTITDASTGEPIMGANIVIEGTTIGTSSDFDGNFTLKIKQGTYSLKISLLGYNTTKVPDVIVLNNKVTAINITLTEGEQLNEVTLTVQKRKNSATALMSMQKKSIKLLDGISFESFSKTGDSDVAAALTRVTGVSVQDGKYIFVRGLSDRYTKTTLNGISIPSLDPDRNSVQMDLFPTNLVDNIIVYKTFTPDLNGDFTGGLVDITMKDFPTKKIASISMGVGYTTGTNFNKDFVLYKKGSYDWLGFGNSTRKLGFPETTHIPDESLNKTKLTDLTNSFSKELGVTKGANTFLDQSFSVNYGNQYEKEKFKIGLNFALNYSNEYKFYDDVIYGAYFKDTDKSINKLDKQEVTKGSLGENNVIWSGLLSTAFKFTNSKYAISLFHSQNGNGQAADYISENFDATNATLYKDAIQYSQRSVTNIIIKGDHYGQEGKFKINWKVSPTISSILEPDVRSTRLSYDVDSDSFSLQLGDGAGIDRYFRSLNEIALATKGDVTYNLENESKIKVGLSNTYKKRDYDILNFRFDKTSNFNSFTENPNDILVDENIWNTTTQSGMFVKGSQNLNNKYLATSNISAIYAMHELELINKLKIIYGVRTEKASINYDGYYNNVLFKKKVHDELVLLPSFNFIYALNEASNFRMSYSQTVARPSFKEKSNAHIQDPISQNTFIGNLDLKETNINNIDLRWENFFKSGQMISVSGFYKHFKNPIELVPFQLSPNSIQPKNSNRAIVYGAELELKKKLTNENAKIIIDFGANITYLISEVDTKNIIVDINGKTEYDLRKENARDNENIERNRTMQGQSPFIINASINLHNDSFNANVNYNVQGEKLIVVGSGIVPDIFEAPFHSLNFKGSYKIGEKYKVSMSFKNILNKKFNQFFKSYGSINEIYKQYSKERSFSMGFSYTF